MSEQVRVTVGVVAALSNGQELYNYLSNNRFVDIEFVITSDRDEDALEIQDGHKVFRNRDANSVLKENNLKQTDYIFVAGWSGLLRDDFLNTPKQGVIGFHPSKLPKDRGRAVLAWQIEEGYTETALSMFYYTDVPDGGDIIAQENIPISQSDTVADVLDKVTFCTRNLITANFPLLRTGKALRFPQNHQEATTRRLRNDCDSEINWQRDAADILNKIRAITRPYPGAITELSGVKYKIWRARPVSDELSNLLDKLDAVDGDKVAEFCDASIVVKCRNGYVWVTEYEAV